MDEFKPSLSTIALSILLFFFFLVFLFPYQNLRGYLFGKIYATTGILINAERLSPSFFGWPGVSLQNVEVTVPLGDKDLELSSEQLTTRVGLGGLFPPVPSLSLYMKRLKKGGNIYVKFSQSSNTVKASIDASGVNLEQIAIPGLAETFNGKLDASGDIFFDQKEMTKSSGYLDLKVDSLRAPGLNFPGFVLPPTKLGTVKAKLLIKNGIAEISNFQFGGTDSDLKGSLAGDIRLGHDVMAFFINLTLRIQLADSYRQNPQAAALVSLLDSFKGASGDYAMKWSASLQEMSTNLISAIPQKVAN